MRQWWSNSTVKEFEEKTRCMIDQYSSYSIQGNNLNGKLTLGENIADNGGIKAAYYSFKKMESYAGRKIVLPGINFTPDQLFFLAFAQLWCVKDIPTNVINLILIDTHTIEQFRVLGTLSNSAEFAKAFNCPLGSRMNPVEKCKVW